MELAVSKTAKDHQHETNQANNKRVQFPPCDVLPRNVRDGRDVSNCAEGYYVFTMVE
jgi:hypothetical protein